MTRSILSCFMAISLLTAPIADARPKNPKKIDKVAVAEAKSGLLETVQAVYDDLGWVSGPVEGDTALRLQYVADSAEWALYAVERTDERVLLFYSVYPQKVAPDRRAAVGEFLGRANWGMRIGSFEMDWRDGQVRYKTSVDVSEGSLTEGMVRDLISANVFTAERYLPGVQSVAYGGASPLVAIQKIESPPAE